MEKDIIILSKIAFIDKMLDDFEYELGDIPKQIKDTEADISHKQEQMFETESIINDIKGFVTASKNTLVVLKAKEDKLSQQQFLIRNNKEFDAISSEIKILKDEHEKLSVKMRTEGQKETNLNATLESQKKELEDIVSILKELNNQFDELSEEHSEEVKNYNNFRKKLKAKIPDELFNIYAAIRKKLYDAAVSIKKGSCNGCYRQVPQQLLVDIRNQHSKIFLCENCGRILIPDWAVVDENELLYEIEK